MRLLGDILQIAIYTSIQIPSEKALFIILLFVIYEVKKQTKKRYDQLFQLPGLQIEWTRKLSICFILFQLSRTEFKLFCANMPTWLKSGSNAGSMEAAAKTPHQPSYIALFLSLYCLFEQRWNFPFLKGLRSCSNVQKKNLRSSEKSKGAFLMSVVLPEYLMRLTPEKTW